MTEEVHYSEAYEKNGSLVCPECGHDFNGETQKQVLAHVEGFHPGFNVSLDSDGAKRKKAILDEIVGKVPK